MRRSLGDGCGMFAGKLRMLELRHSSVLDFTRSFDDGKKASWVSACARAPGGLGRAVWRAAFAPGLQSAQQRTRQALIVVVHNVCTMV